MKSVKPLIKLASLLLILPFLFPMQTYAQTDSPSPRLVIDKVDDSGYPTIHVNFALLDAQGFPINNLMKGSLTISEDLNLVTSFDLEAIQDDTQPLAFVLAIDTSGSMGGQSIKDAVNAGKDFILKLSPQDVVGLISYSDQVNVLSDPTPDHNSVIAALDSLQPTGETAMYDAIIAANKILKDRSERKVIILLSDGQNNSGTYSLDDVILDSTRWGIPIYPVGFGDANKTTLVKLAGLTGGSYQLTPDTSTLRQSFDSILGIFRNQFKISYISGFPADKKEHNLSISATYEGGEYNSEGKFIARPGDLSIRMNGLDEQGEIRGWVVFAPEFIAPGDIAQFQVLLDGDLLDEKFEDPFEITWNSTLGEYNEHEFIFRAKDQVGNEGEQKLNLTIKPPILISIDSPSDGARVSGTQIVQFTIDAEYQITSLEVFANEVSLAVLDPKERSYTWDTRALETGEYTISVRVKDAQDFSDFGSIKTIVEVQKPSLVLWVGVIALLIAAGVIVPLSIRSRKKLTKNIATDGVVIRGAPVLVELEGLSPKFSWKIASEEIRLGRNKEENDIPLKGLKASRRQAIIRCRGGVCTLFSLNPDNPAVINGSPVTQRTLEPGDVISLGESVFRFDRVE